MEEDRQQKLGTNLQVDNCFPKDFRPSLLQKVGREAPSVFEQKGGIISTCISQESIHLEYGVLVEEQGEFFLCSGAVLARRRQLNLRKLL